jgi:hypothetical protein
MEASMLRASCFTLSMLVVLACGDDSTAPSGGAGNTPVAGSSPGGGTGEGASGAGVAGGPQGGEPQGGADGGNGAGPVGGAPPSCDGDGDDELVAGPGCCGAPDTCDCDDNDSDVFTDQQAYFSEPRPTEDDPVLQWDYNCDGIAEKQYLQSDGCGALACLETSTEFQGDGGDYFCGAPGTLIICQNAGLKCETQGGATLACR